jgi:hypothetical protein
MLDRENVKCCMCGKGPGDEVTALAVSKVTGHALCKGCADEISKDLDVDVEMAQKAAMMSFIQRELLDQKKDDDGTCNCPRCLYDKMKRAEAGADTSREGFAAEPITDTRH